MVDPNVAKAGGLQSQEEPLNNIKLEASSRKAGASEGEVVVLYFKPSATQNLKSSGFPDVLGRSSKSEAQRGNNMAKSPPSFEFTNGGIQKYVILL